MPAALDIDREAVRVLVVAIGPRAAARELGIPEATVQAWSARGGWLEKHREAKEIAASRVREREAMQGRVQPIATVTPAEALSSVLADDSRETRISLSRGARTMAKKLEDATPEQAGDALQVGKLASLVHGWQMAGDVSIQVNALSFSVST